MDQRIGGKKRVRPQGIETAVSDGQTGVAVNTRETTMTIKNILVPFNTAEASKAALSIALKMAHKYDAHVTGLFCVDPARPLRNGLGTYEMIVKAVQEGHEKLKAEATELFNSQVSAEAADIKERVHWITARRDADSAVAEYARYQDVTVIGASASGTVPEETEFHADSIALVSGRPVLVVPRDYKTDTLVEHAVIAWDGKRAAARALGDAMQILESKSKVTILSVGEAPAAPTVEGLDIVEHLKRHGVEAQFAHEPRNGRSVAATIIDFCAREGAGILVMGAYEHSKFNEDIFGGVTNSVIRKLKIPTMMSH